MRVAFVGSDGLIGSNLIHDLSESTEWTLFPINKFNFGAYFDNDQSFDVCVNCNGNSSRMQAEKDARKAYVDNVISTQIIITSIKAKRYIHISSGDVYAQTHKCCEYYTPLVDDSIGDLDYKYNYGHTKVLAEKAVKFLCDDYVILRCCSVLGKGLKKGVVYDLLTSEKTYFSLDSSFQFITTTELSNIIKFFVENDQHKNKIYNVAGFYSVGSCVIADMLGKPFVSHLNPVKYSRQISNARLFDIYPTLKTSKKYLQDFINEYRGDC